jgi:hypothetical protein
MCEGPVNRARNTLLNDGEVPRTRVQEDNLALQAGEEPAMTHDTKYAIGVDFAARDQHLQDVAKTMQDAHLADAILGTCLSVPGEVEVKGEGCNQVYAYERVFSTPTFKPIIKVIGGLSLFLAVKNMKYGNSAIEPKRIFSKASAEEQILVRLDDKMSRLMESKDNGLAKNDVTDIIGYLILYCVVKGWFSFRDLLD